jgi:hypothetical protein
MMITLREVAHVPAPAGTPCPTPCCIEIDSSCVTLDMEAGA